VIDVTVSFGCDWTAANNAACVSRVCACGNDVVNVEVALPVGKVEVTGGTTAGRVNADTKALVDGTTDPTLTTTGVVADKTTARFRTVTGGAADTATSGVTIDDTTDVEAVEAVEPTVTAAEVADDDAMVPGATTMAGCATVATMRSTVKTTAGATEAVTAAEDAEVVLAASGGGAPRAAGMSARGGRRTSTSGRLDADMAGTIVGAT
jgi:hypothetical protein